MMTPDGFRSKILCEKCVTYLNVTYISLLLALLPSVSSEHVHKISPESNLRHFEVLHRDDIIHHRTQAQNKNLAISISQQLCSATLHFSAFGINFHFKMNCQRSIFSKNARLKVMDESSMESDEFLDIDKYSPFEGFSKEKGTIHGYISPDGDVVATIHYPKESFYVESSEPYLGFSTNHTMIIYRASDLKQSTLNTVEGMQRNHRPIGVSSGNLRSKRRKRAASSKDTCSVKIVVDHKFYEHIGLRDVAVTVNYINSIMYEVDSIYRSTNFGEGHNQLGIEIAEIEILSKPSLENDHFNSARENWSSMDFLKAFGRASNMTSFCLGHLFTYTKFDGGSLGIAWIASPEENSLGGVCSQSSEGMSINIGLTTAQNSLGERVPSRMLHLVTAHEIGHNWGSPHDLECIPHADEGGKYTMYQNSVSGSLPNNDKFSECSIARMKLVINAKRDSCFTDKHNSFCGNSRVELSEECDGGFSMKQDQDACCDSNCQLRSGTTCSDVNAECCSGCQMRSSGKECFRSEFGSCISNALCQDGNETCPSPTNLPDDTGCIEGGKCKSGVCQSICKGLNLLDCLCTGDIECLVCCKSDATAQCLPAQSGVQRLSDGSMCSSGYCENGICVMARRLEDTRLWSFIKNKDFNMILVFMRDNLVITCIIISLLFYIPIAIIIICMDMKEKDEDADVRGWMKNSGTHFYDKDRKGRRPAITKTYRKSRMHLKGSEQDKYVERSGGSPMKL